MEPKEIKALLTLLEDPDREVFEAVSKNLTDKGIDIIPELERAWETSSNENTQERLESIIHNIQLDSTKQSLTTWKNSKNNDLLEGAFIISKFQYPELSYDSINSKVEAIKKEVWLEINDNLTALEKVRIINHFLFKKHRFSRNASNLYAPQNSYINLLLETKKGNAISLAVLYAVIAQRLGLPLTGVDLPRNLILAYKDIYGVMDNDGVLFYINPLNKGSVLSRKEIDYYLRHQQIEPIDEYYHPCSNILIIRKLIHTLIASYERLGFNDKIEQLNEFALILQVI